MLSFKSYLADTEVGVLDINDLRGNDARLAVHKGTHEKPRIRQVDVLLHPALLHAAELRHLQQADHERAYVIIKVTLLINHYNKNKLANYF